MIALGPDRRRGATATGERGVDGDSIRSARCNKPSGSLVQGASRGFLAGPSDREHPRWVHIRRGHDHAASFTRAA